MNNQDQIVSQSNRQNDGNTRDLDQERKEYERMIARQSEASREYTIGKLRSA